MNKKILWVTSFARDMWEASGKPLLESYAATGCGTHSRLFMATEGIDHSKVAGPPGCILTYDLDRDRFLKEFLEANEDIIPTHLGGKHRFPECTCKGGPFGPHDKRHKLPCVGHWFCKNFSRWFRKVAAMKAAVELHPDTDILIWVDADCRFKREVTQKVIVHDWFKLAYGFFYLKSKRPVMETGLVGYWLPNAGKKVLDHLVGRYASGAFRKDPRWDDSYQTQVALAEAKCTAVDLATKVGEHAAVVADSALGPYIEHDKGRHGRGLGIMT